MRACKEFDPAVGLDGAWIAPNGDVYHVERYGRHSEVIAELTGSSSYYKAFEKGWVRMGSYCEAHEIHAQFDLKHASVPALQALRRALRVADAAGKKFDMLEDTSGVLALDKESFFTACGSITKAIGMVMASNAAKAPS